MTKINNMKKKISPVSYFINLALVFLLFLAFSQNALSDEESDAEESNIEVDVTTEATNLFGKDKDGRPNHRFFNLHLSGGVIFELQNSVSDHDMGQYGGQGLIGMDFNIFDPLALSILSGYNAFFGGGDKNLEDFFIGAGFRFRIFSDRKGALNEKGGNVLGNLWVDAHFGYHHYNNENHAGINIGFGYEFAWGKNFNMGPYGMVLFTPIGEGVNYSMMGAGIQISLAGQFEPDDMDKDGVLDENDKCPRIPEDIDGFEDTNGCPEDDNDSDGIKDVDDKCPNEPENFNTVQDEDGCPEDDNDFDGIKNEVDGCPMDPEDIDKFQDEDGCPDIDDDEDGVLDELDKCRFEKEDIDGFEDEDGCPDTDNDGDRILDVDDSCPNEPETQNGIDDEDGCPDLVRIIDNKIEILQKIFFATNKDKILKKSFPVLDEVASVIILKKNIRIRIEGHTDDKGRDKKNLKLSQNRAASVMKYLEEKGVKTDRLESVGYGEEKPIADNKTSDGRAKNRRVEFFILPADTSLETEEATAEPEKETVKEADVKPEKETKKEAAVEPEKKAKAKDKPEKKVKKAKAKDKPEKKAAPSEPAN